MAEGFVLAVQSWMAIGLVVGVAFVIAGLNRLDRAASGASIGLRALLLPAAVLLWPWILYRWIRTPRMPVECTYHRCAVDVDPSEEG